MVVAAPVGVMLPSTATGEVLDGGTVEGPDGLGEPDPGVITGIPANSADAVIGSVLDSVDVAIAPPCALLGPRIN